MRQKQGASPKHVESRFVDAQFDVLSLVFNRGPAEVWRAALRLCDRSQFSGALQYWALGVLADAGRPSLLESKCESRLSEKPRRDGQTNNSANP